VADVRGYLADGKWTEALDVLDLYDQGALHLARARQASIPAGERDRLRALAARCDPFGGYVHKALSDWPRPS